MIDGAAPGWRREVDDALCPTRERRERAGVVKIALDQLGAGNNQRRLARAHQGSDPIATPKLGQGSARNIAATDDQ
jgi:hypothetical protein